jgi:hypothetical protein
MADPVLDDAGKGVAAHGCGNSAPLCPPDPPPPDDVPADPNGHLVRAGWCEPVHGCRLPWAAYRKGCRYRFEECANEKGRRYYRVYAGEGYGVVGPGRFADLFAEEG